MNVLPDLVIDPLSLIAYASVLWIMLGVVAGVTALTVILIVIFTRKRKRNIQKAEENRNERKSL